MKFKSNVDVQADLTANHLIKQGGQDTQFLKADGSVDNNVYITAADLPSTLDLYATTYASDVSGYAVLVRNISDIRFNTVAVNVPTGVITTTNQLLASLITDANIISGNPGIFDFTTIGNIQRISGTGQADFYFRIYKRDASGAETFITQSNNTLPVLNTGYAEFSAVALWNDGIFLDTDRIVLKYYGNRVPTGSDPSFQFQFGGISPVRSTAAIPVAVIPNIYLRDLADVENVDALNNEVLYWNDTASLWEHSLVINLMSQSNSTTNGYLSSTNWTTFNSKANASGTTNYVSKFTGASTLGNSLIYDNGTNVGIGTTTPATKLDVGGIINIQNSGADGNLNEVLRFTLAGYPSQWMNSIYSTVSATNVGRLKFSIGNGLTSQIDVLSLCGTGNVLIGTLTDNGSNKLQVNGSILGTGYSLYDGIDYGQIIQPSVGALQIGSLDGYWGNVDLYSSGNFVMRLSNASNVLIGTDVDNGTDRLQVNGSSYFEGLARFNEGIWTAGVLIDYNSDLQFFSDGYLVSLSPTIATDNRNILLPNASGTIALTSQLPTNPITGTGTTNYIPKFTGTSTLGNSLIFDNGTKVGVGTNDPLEALDVRSVNGIIRVGASGNYSTLQWNNDAAFTALSSNGAANWPIYFKQNANVRMTVSSGAGNILIGTTADNGVDKLQVNGSALVNQLKYTRAIDVSGTDLNNLTDAGFYNGSGLTNAPNSGWFYITVERYTTTTDWVHQTATSFGSGNTANIVYSRVRGGGWTTWSILTTGSGTTNYLTKFTGASALGNSQIFDNGTNVGIGTASPAYKLDVRGGAYINGLLSVMSGEGFNDEGMIGILYDRNELTNAAYRGSTTINITGTGTFVDNISTKNIITNAKGDFMEISSLSNSSVVEIKFQIPEPALNYGNATWQPFLQTRLSPELSTTSPRSIVAEVSTDGITWYKASSGWETTDFISNNNSGLWMGNFGVPIDLPGYTWSFARFILSDFRVGTTYGLWLSQVGIRHRSAPATRQFVSALGDTMYGDLKVMNGNVGIGIAAPTSKLDVAGAIRAVLPDPTGVGGITAKFISYSPSPYGLIFRSYSTGQHSIQCQREANNVELYPLSLQPLGSNVLIGTTTDNGGDKLQVNGSANFAGQAKLQAGAYVPPDTNIILDGADNGYFRIYSNSGSPYGSDVLVIGSQAGAFVSFSEDDGKTIFESSVEADSFIKTGGLSTQLLKADGGVTVGYKVYTALLAQSGTSAPTAIVLENTLGGTVVWGYSSVGIYTATLTGAFVDNKTAVFISSVFGTIIAGQRTSSNVVNVATYNSSGVLSNGFMSGNSIEIRVYN